MKVIKVLLMLVAAGFVLTVAGNARAIEFGPDEFGYTLKDSAEDDVTYEWIDIVTEGDGQGTLWDSPGDDDNTDIIELGFNFTFYGQVYDAVYVHSNGFLRFDATSYEYYMGTQCPLPLDDDVNEMIGFYYRDFAPNDGGEIWYRVDTDPARFIVTYDAVPICCIGAEDPPDIFPDPITVQVVMYDTGEIQVNIQDAGEDTGGTQGSDTTIGIEARDAIAGLSLPDCLTEGSTMDDYSVRFYPPEGGTPVLPGRVVHWGMPEDVLTFDYYIFNLTDAELDFAIVASGSSWSPELSADSLTLAAGGSSPLTLTVTLPADSVGGDGDETVITVTPAGLDPITVRAVALVQAEADEWQDLPPAPLPVESSAAGGDGNVVLVAGGFRVDEITSMFAIADYLQVYDVTTNTWADSETGGVQPMTNGRARTAGCAMDGKFYVAGGYATLDEDPQLAQDLYIYDIATDIWSTGSLMPNNKVGHSMVCDSNSGQVFAMAGMSDLSGTSETNMEAVDLVYIYDVGDDSWSTDDATMTGTRSFFAAGQIDNDTIIVAGGYYDGFAGPQTEAYSIADGTWTALEDLASARIFGSPGVLADGLMCIVGGYAFAGVYEDTFECYFDPYWIPQAAPMVQARMYHAGATLNDQIYAIVGELQDELGQRVVMNAFERYPSSDIPDPTEDTPDAVEPVPDTAEPTPDADVAPDAPDDVPGDTAPDTTGDTSEDAPADIPSEGDDGDDNGCGCTMVR